MDKNDRRKEKSDVQNENRTPGDRRNILRRGQDKEWYVMAQKAHEMAKEAESIAEKAINAIVTHEKICGERYGRIVKLQTWTLAVMSASVIGIVTALAYAARYLLEALLKAKGITP